MIVAAAAEAIIAAREEERLQRLYEADRRSRTRRAHENAEVQALHQELLGRPLGEASHRLLHRTHTDRSPHGAAV